jgi:hypothetical protein
MIISLVKSKKANKRFQVSVERKDGTIEKYDFGYSNGSTYIDHKDETKRLNYWKRHTANETERRLIQNLVPSPALFSAYLLWGKYPDIYKNIKLLNDEFRDRKLF